MEKSKLMERLEELIKRGNKLAWTGEEDPFSELGRDEFLQWRLSCQNLLRYFFGEKHPFYEEFGAYTEISTGNNNSSAIRKGRAVLEHIKEEIELGFTIDAQHLYEANLFSNLLEQAYELTEKDYLVAAAVYCRVVIENSISDLCRMNGIENWKAEKFSQRLVLLRKEGIIDKPLERMIQARYDIGSYAAHGDERFNKYSKKEILEMLEETRNKILTIC